MSQKAKIAHMIMGQIELAMQEERAKAGICAMFGDRLLRINKHCYERNILGMTFFVKGIFADSMKKACDELGYTSLLFPIPGSDDLDRVSMYQLHNKTTAMWDTSDYGMKRRALFYKVWHYIKLEMES